MSHDVAIDVHRALSVLFRDGASLTASDLAREIAFVHGWLGIAEAEDAVARLVKTGWLVEEEGGLQPAERLQDLHLPLGWMPRPAHLLEAGPWSPKMAQVEADTKPPADAAPSPSKAPDIDDLPAENSDPRSKVEGRLLAFIARQSGLDRAEVQRRAERKRQALRPCTSWLAMALVAREQGLDMGAIVDALSPKAQS